MIYITGKNETLGDPNTQSEFLDFISNTSKFYQANPHLIRYKPGSCLPPHTPLLLTDDFPELKQHVMELNSLLSEERERLWLFQESNIDIPTLLATNEIMCEAQKYAKKFRKFCNDPLISKPWSTDPFLTNNTLFDLIPGACGIAAGTLRRIRYVDPLDALYDAMCTRDAFNTEIARLSQNKHKYHARIAQLEKLARDQTKIIKELLPKKVSEKLVKYLNMRGINLYKTRGNHYSKKLARKGKLATLGLEFLEKTGIEKTKKLIRSLIKLGKYAEKTTFALGAGFVVYDTYEAAKQKQDFTKVFLSGTAGFCAGLYMGSVASFSGWGACAISTLAGEAALGGLILASFPIIGTCVLMVVGAAVVGTVTYVAVGAAKNALDTEMGTQVSEEITKDINILYELIKRAWHFNETWIIKYYGTDTIE